MLLFTSNAGFPINYNCCSKSSPFQTKKYKWHGLQSHPSGLCVTLYTLEYQLRTQANWKLIGNNAHLLICQLKHHLLFVKWKLYNKVNKKNNPASYGKDRLNKCIFKSKLMVKYFRVSREKGVALEIKYWFYDLDSHFFLKRNLVSQACTLTLSIFLFSRGQTAQTFVFPYDVILW